MQDLQSMLGGLQQLSFDELLALRDALDDQLQAQPSSPEAWADDFRRWAEGHRRLSHEADDSRESIYEGRGE